MKPFEVEYKERSERYVVLNYERDKQVYLLTHQSTGKLFYVDCGIFVRDYKVININF